MRKLSGRRDQNFKCALTNIEYLVLHKPIDLP